MSYTNSGGIASPTSSIPPWFGSPVQSPPGQAYQFPHVQPPQMPQAPQPQAQQPQAQTPYQRMMQGNGLQQFQNNMGAANQQTPAAQPQGPQAQQQQQPDPGLLRLLAVNLAECSVVVVALMVPLHRQLLTQQTPKGSTKGVKLFDARGNPQAR